MTLVFNPQLENSPLNDVRDAIDSGGTAGSLDILDGSTVLASLTLSLPSFADESGGQSIANTISSAVATFSGSPDGFIFKTSIGETVFSGDIPADLNLGASTINAGNIVGVSSFVLTEGTVQARAYASTVVYPYNTPPLDFDNPAVPSSLVDPKDLKLDLLRGQDYESDGATLRTATYDGADILLDGVPLVSVADVKALDLTFDSADNALVVYTDSSDNLFVYDDSDQSTTQLQTAGDPDFAGVEALLHFDGADGSTTITDETGRAWQTQGSAELDTGLAKFGPSSLNMPSSPACAQTLGNKSPGEFSVLQDFTAECWVYSTAFNPESTVFVHGDDFAGFRFRLLSNRMWFTIGGATLSQVYSTSGIPTNQWIHIAIVRDGNTMRLFRDGTDRGTSTVDSSAADAALSQPVAVGAEAGGSSAWIGWVDDFRFTAGVARYTAPFTPPTKPFPDSAGGPATGQDPRIHNDRQVSESITLSYRRGNDVFYRLAE